MDYKYLVTSGRTFEMNDLNHKIKKLLIEDYVAGEGYDEKSLSFENEVCYSKRGNTNLFLGENYSAYSYFRTRTTMVDNKRKGLFSKLIIKVHSKNAEKLIEISQEFLSQKAV